MLFEGRIACEISTLSDDKPGNLIQMLSAADGRPLWSRAFVPGSQHKKQARAMFVGSTLWLLTNQGCAAIDPASGRQEKSFPGGSGHCFPPVATTKFVIHGEMHLTDLVSGELDVNPITKGNCSRDVGFLPVNGLIYTTPKHCICWPMLRDYTALAAAKADSPASEMPQRPDEIPFLCDAARPLRKGRRSLRRRPVALLPARRLAGGHTGGHVPPELCVRWTADLGGLARGTNRRRLADRLLHPRPGHAAGGRGAFGLRRPARRPAKSWPSMRPAAACAGGRPSTAASTHPHHSPWAVPVRHQERLGLRPAGRRRPAGLAVPRAPLDERIVAYGQVESPWPVPGSVLVVNDVLYFAAGRQPLADGGILVFALQPDSGRRLWVARIDHVPQQFDKVKTPFLQLVGLGVRQLRPVAPRGGRGGHVAVGSSNARAAAWPATATTASCAWTPSAQRRRGLVAAGLLVVRAPQRDRV